MSADRISRIRAKLESSFNPVELEIVDESHLHAGHAGAQSGKGHFRIRIVSARFRDTKPLERHRMVFDSLDEMMITEIHALSVTAVAPD